MHDYDCQWAKIMYLPTYKVLPNISVPFNSSTAFWADSLSWRSSRHQICVFYVHNMYNNNKMLLPPKASAEGGLYLKGNWLLWSVYDGNTMERVWWVTMIMHEGLLWISNDWLLWYMCHTSMCRLTYGLCHIFWQMLVTIENDDVSTNWL